jgi:hypothetical protein
MLVMPSLHKGRSLAWPFKVAYLSSTFTVCISILSLAGLEVEAHTLFTRTHTSSHARLHIRAKDETSSKADGGAVKFKSLKIGDMDIQ